MLQSSSGVGESVQRWCAYRRMSTDMIGSMIVGVGVTRGKEEILSTKGIQERREGIAKAVEVGMGAGMGIGAREGVVEQLNLMAIVVMVGVFSERRTLGRKLKGGVCYSH